MLGFYRGQKLVLLLLALIALTTLVDQSDCGILYPQESEKRQLSSLDGLWNFRTANRSNQEEGFVGQWYTRPLEKVLNRINIISNDLYSLSNSDWTSNLDASAFQLQ